jgi:hypothetical protein
MKKPYAAWALLVTAGLTCAMPLFARYDDTIFEPHTFEVLRATFIPAPTVAVASATTIIQGIGLGE